MAVSKGLAAFEKLAQQNRDTIMKNRGAKSPYRDIDAPVGAYYARIIKNPLDTANVDQKDKDGKKTGFKKETMRARLQVSIVCSADPQCTPAELEKHKGSAGFIQFYLPDGDNEAWQRYYDTLDLIGVDTNGIVLTQDEIQDADNQYTLAQVSEFIEEQKPFCLIAITSPGGGTNKFINYKSSAEQGDIEQLIGHEIDSSAETVLEEEAAAEEPAAYAQVPDTTAPFEGSSDVPADEEPAEDEWEQVGELWHNKTKDTWHDETGEEVENPNKPKAPPAKPKGPGFAQKPSSASAPTSASASAPTKPSVPVTPKPTAPKPGMGGMKITPKPGARK